MIAILALSLAIAAVRGPTDAQIDDLQQRLHGMHVVLLRLDRADAAGAPPLMRQHWDALQAYMEELIGLMPPPEPRRGRPDCRVGNRWTRQALPDDVGADAYRSAMHALDAQLREQLRQARATTVPAERVLRLQAHWTHVYQALQGLRGLGWMFGRWMPARDAGVLPEPDAEGARLLGALCTQCHALPAPSLHTAERWQALIATMDRHMTRSDTPIPMCVTAAPPDDRRVLLDYLQRHARDAR